MTTSAGRDGEVSESSQFGPRCWVGARLADQSALDRRPPNLVRVVLVDQRPVEAAPVSVVVDPDRSSDLRGEHRWEGTGGERIAAHEDPTARLAARDPVSGHEDLRQDVLLASRRPRERLSCPGPFGLLADEACEVASLDFLRQPE